MSSPLIISTNQPNYITFVGQNNTFFKRIVLDGRIIPLFFSDFTYATGSSFAAQQDGSGSSAKWDFIGGSSACIVTSSVGLDFPTAYCLQAPHSPATFSLIRTTQLPVLQVGDTRSFRWYFRCAMPVVDNRIASGGGLNDWNFHPVQDGFAGSNCNWAFETNTSGSQWLAWFFLGNGPTVPDGYQRWFAPMLNKNQTYRFEWQMYRDTSTTFQASAYIFDATGSLLYGPTDFVNQAAPAYNMVTVRGNVPVSASFGNFPFHDVNNTNGLNAGTNDTYTLTPADPALIQSFQAGFVVADNVSGGIIGPYQSVVGEDSPL